MEINSFIEKFAEQLEKVKVTDLKPETKFRDIEEWSSLMALSIIAMVDEEYEVIIKGEDIRNSKTINDLFEVVKSRL
ncbi:MAG TPA: acyl carrier protein [Ignavibacteria bacterium]